MGFNGFSGLLGPGKTHADPFSVAHMLPRTSKGITNLQIAPQTNNGLALPTTKSRKSSQSVNPRIPPCGPYQAWHTLLYERLMSLLVNTGPRRSATAYWETTTSAVPNNIFLSGHEIADTGQFSADSRPEMKPHLRSAGLPSSEARWPARDQPGRLANHAGKSAGPASGSLSQADRCCASTEARWPVRGGGKTTAASPASQTDRDHASKSCELESPYHWYYYFDYPYYHWRRIITASTIVVVGSASGLRSGLLFAVQLGCLSPKC
ncbi:hypothetical protein DPMN_057864 [Dreissena polymorpha]|uniref:Uncharacterized protein n=1 Tax=Dreissena polymorpha TaxID=45954 RepID=A0A9D4HES5_DREPO|nr:hypothetical protein DPMN_057864 [Dreissena polymorpha]